MESHYCIPGHWGGFLEEVARGTSLAHVVEHVALELQYIAGMDVSFSRTQWTSTPGVALVVYEYEQAEAGRVAVRLVRTLAQGEDYPLEELIADLGELRQRRRRWGRVRKPLCANASGGEFPGRNGRWG